MGTRTKGDNTSGTAIPIAMTTYVPHEGYSPLRTEYLRRSIRSLEESDADLSLLHIFDDNSEYEPHQQLLNDLSSKYEIKIREKRIGAFLNCRLAITEMCKYGTDYVVYLQDDIIASKNWLRKGMKIMADVKSAENTIILGKPIPEIGILSLFNFDKKDLFQGLPNGQQWMWVNYGHPGGVAWIVDVRCWQKYCKRWPIKAELNTMPKNDRKRTVHRMHLADWKICHCMNVMLIYQAVTRNSLIDHIGVQSAIRKAHMEHCCNMENFDGDN